MADIFNIKRGGFQIFIESSALPAAGILLGGSICLGLKFEICPANLQAMAKGTELRVNGKPYVIELDPDTRLLEVLRDHLDLTGTKYGCGEGQCGACTVLIDGNPRRSCLTPASAAENKEITTIEGLAKNGRLHPVQQAFLDAEALQCGYCTPGMVMSAVALLRSNPGPNEEEIVNFMKGNMCRCGTYPRIVAAIRRARDLMRKSGS